jgi:hypothetical protein
MRYDTQHDYDERRRLDAEEPPDTERTPEAEHTPEEEAERTEAERTAEAPYPAQAEHTPEEDARPVPEAQHPVDAEQLAEPMAEPMTEPMAEPEPEPVVAAAAVPPPAVTETDAETAALWPQETIHELQQRFREVQWRFVDDPRGAADEAHALVTEALAQFSDTIESRKRELDGWRDSDGGDTEQMRMVVRRYRSLLDRLLAT